MNDSEKDKADKVLIELITKSNEFIESVFDKVIESGLSPVYANATLLTIFSLISSTYFKNVDEKHRKKMMKGFISAIEKSIT